MGDRQSLRDDHAEAPGRSAAGNFVHSKPEAARYEAADSAAMAANAVAGWDGKEKTMEAGYPRKCEASSEPLTTRKHHVQKM